MIMYRDLQGLQNENIAGYKGLRLSWYKTKRYDLNVVSDLLMIAGP